MVLAHFWLQPPPFADLLMGFWQQLITRKQIPFGRQHEDVPY